MLRVTILHDFDREYHALACYFYDAGREPRVLGSRAFCGRVDVSRRLPASRALPRQAYRDAFASPVPPPLPVMTRRRLFADFRRDF